MSVPTKASANSVFELKSAALTVLALQLRTLDLPELERALDAKYGATPGLFEHEPLCLDLSHVQDEPTEPDFDRMLTILKRHGFNPMAVRGGSAAQMMIALEAGLAEAPEVGPVSRAEADPESETVVAADAMPLPTSASEASEAGEEMPTASSAAEAGTTMAASEAGVRTVIIDRPLRSGQQVYARGGDLIVLAVVSYGAEVIADGSIHVYAPLRGRALAGARGDVNARIFAACMEPQLVSIAGTWRTTEAGLAPDVAGKPAQVRLDGDKLLFEPLKF